MKFSQVPTQPTWTAADFLLGVSSGAIDQKVALSVLSAWLFNQVNISDVSGSPRLRDSETMRNAVTSGGIWTPDAVGSNRNASMTAMVIYINGRRITISAVTARTFTASKDTYVDVLDNLDGTGTLVYTEVANNAASPTLAANSVRLAIGITGASAMSSVNQGSTAAVAPVLSNQIITVADSIGNTINPQPGQILVGYSYAAVATNNTAGTDVAGATITVNVPTGKRVELYGELTFLSLGGIATHGALVQIKESSTVLNPNTAYTAAPNNGINYKNAAIAVITPSAGVHTYKLSAVAVGSNINQVAGLIYAKIV